MMRDRRTEVSQRRSEERYRRPEPIAVLGRGRVVLTGATALLALLAYFRAAQNPTPLTRPNEVANEPAAISVVQEIALGQRAGPFLAARHEGLTDQENLQREVLRIGEHIVYRNKLENSGFQFRFYVLADTRSVQTFVLPGGAIYVTAGAMNRLNSEGEIAAVLAHAVAHTLRGHPLQLLRSVDALPGVPATTILAEIDPRVPHSLDTQRVRALVETTIQLQYTASQIAEADSQMLVLVSNAGYHPESMVTAWERLLSDGRDIQQVGFASTHFDRIERLRSAVASAFPRGIPTSMTR